MKKNIYLTLISFLLTMSVCFGQTPEKMMEKINKAKGYNLVDIETKCGTITYKYEEDNLRLISYSTATGMGTTVTSYYFDNNGSVFSILQNTYFDGMQVDENGNPTDEPNKDSTYFLIKSAKVYKAMKNGKEEKVTDDDVKGFLDEIETMVQMSQSADRTGILHSDIICTGLQDSGEGGYEGGDEGGDGFGEYDPELAQKTKERFMSEGWECLSAQPGTTLTELFNGDWDVDAEQSTVKVKIVTNSKGMVDYSKSTWIELTVENVESHAAFRTTNDCENHPTLVNNEQIDTLIVFSYPEANVCYTFDVFQQGESYQLVLTAVDSNYQRILFRGPRG